MREMILFEKPRGGKPWQKGHVPLVDNLAVLHARRSFDPPRRTLALLCK